MDSELVRIRREKMEKMLEKTKKGNNMETKIEVGADNFQQLVIEQSKKVPVVVDFWAVWCSPCLILGPILEKLAKEYEGKFILAKLDVNDNQELAQKYGITGIPAVKMFKNGQVADEFLGAMPEHMVKGWLEKNLG